MRKPYSHILVTLALCGLASLASSCHSEPEPDKAGGLEICFADGIASTKADHVGHKATQFDRNTNIFVCIDYYRKDGTSDSKLAYVHGAQFTKSGSRNVFTSPYSIIWLDDYYFDMYAVYPYDVEVRDIQYPENPETIYHVVRDVSYTHDVQYLDEGADWYVTSGATIMADSLNQTRASDPHDLITSMVLTREEAPDAKHITNGTQYTDHGEEPVQLTFMHRLSRLEPYFVNGMGDSEDVTLLGIAIYPTAIKSSFAVKRHMWVPRQRQDVFKYEEEGGSRWYHKSGDSWESIDDASEWMSYFEDAPMKYVFNTGFELESSSAVMAQDEVVIDGVVRRPYVEFRMLPDSDIDCMIMHFHINGTEHAYVPVRIDKSMNQNRDFLTQMGHTTRLVLSYKATMITLLYVNYNDWDALPGRFVIGNMQFGNPDSSEQCNKGVRL